MYVIIITKENEAINLRGRHGRTKGRKGEGESDVILFELKMHFKNKINKAKLLKRLKSNNIKRTPLKQ